MRLSEGLLILTWMILLEGRSELNVCVPCFDAGFGVCVWNGMASAHHNRLVRKQKVFELGMLFHGFDVVIILGPWLS